MRTIVLHYDAASQLTDLKRYASTSASSLRVHSRFGRDGAGRLTNITHGGTTIAAGQQWDGSATPPASLGSSELLAGYTFAYDQANRLTELRSWGRKGDGGGFCFRPEVFWRLSPLKRTTQCPGSHESTKLV